MAILPNILCDILGRDGYWIPSGGVMDTTLPWFDRILPFEVLLTFMRTRRPTFSVYCTASGNGTAPVL